ncbi:MAG: hypothetical protein ACTSWN_17470 [Promethearchaeota archaeon]
MKLSTRLKLARVWSLIYIAFAGIIITGLLIIEYYNGVLGAYPGYDIQMYLTADVHTSRYLTWADLVFNVDNMAAEFLYDIITSLFLGGFYLSMISIAGTPDKNQSGTSETKKLESDQKRGLIFLSVALAILIFGLLGSAGLYGYQEKGLDERLIFFSGLNDYQFTGMILPMILLISGFAASGFIPLRNLVGLPWKFEKKSLYFSGAGLLIFSIAFLFSPIHWNFIFFHPNLVMTLLKLWIMAIVTSVYAINLYIRRALKSGVETGIEIPWKKKSIKWYWQIVFILPFWVIFFWSLGYIAYGSLILGFPSDFALEPALLIQSLFNIIFSVSLTIAFLHLGKIIINGICINKSKGGTNR